MQATHRQVKAHLGRLYDELVQHDGFGEFTVDIRILKRGQKEVVIRCGRQYRYVVDFVPGADSPGEEGLPA